MSDWRGNLILTVILDRQAEEEPVEEVPGQGEAQGWRCEEEIRGRHQGGYGNSNPLRVNRLATLALTWVDAAAITALGRRLCYGL